MLGPALALLAAAPVTGDSLVGVYETHQMEVAAGLELKRGGKFEYGLSYGAVDEVGQGNWSFDGKAVHLTSDPMPRAPAFELVRDEPAPKGELSMTLEDPGFEWGHGLEAIAKGDSARAFSFLQQQQKQLASLPPEGRGTGLAAYFAAAAVVAGLPGPEKLDAGRLWRAA